MRNKVKFLKKKENETEQSSSEKEIKCNVM